MAAFIADGWTLADNLEKTIDKWTEGWMNKLKCGSRACDVRACLRLKSQEGQGFSQVNVKRLVEKSPSKQKEVVF